MFGLLLFLSLPGIRNAGDPKEMHEIDFICSTGEKYLSNVVRLQSVKKPLEIG